jgi:hypothetical protein
MSYSYRDILEDGIVVCVSCGSADVNENHQEKNSLPSDWCFVCNHNEGTINCMPDDKYFYNQAIETLKKLKASEL